MSLYREQRLFLSLCAYIHTRYIYLQHVHIVQQLSESRYSRGYIGSALRRPPVSKPTIASFHCVFHCCAHGSPLVRLPIPARISSSYNAAARPIVKAARVYIYIPASQQISISAISPDPRAAHFLPLGCCCHCCFLYSSRDYAILRQYIARTLVGYIYMYMCSLFTGDTRRCADARVYKCSTFIPIPSLPLIYIPARRIFQTFIDKAEYQRIYTLLLGHLKVL